MSIFFIPAIKTNAVIRFQKQFGFTRRDCVLVILNGLCLRDSFSFRICIDKCYCIFTCFRLRLDNPIASHIGKIILIFPLRKALSIILRNISSSRGIHRFTSSHIRHGFQSFSIKALEGNRVNRAIAINCVYGYSFCHKRIIIIRLPFLKSTTLGIDCRNIRNRRRPTFFYSIFLNNFTSVFECDNKCFRLIIRTFA